MTVSEMHTAVYLELDKSSSFQVAAFEPEDVNFWLNQAQLQYTKEKLFGKNNVGSYYENPKSVDDLQGLFNTITLTSTNYADHETYPNVYVQPLDAAIINDYMFYISSTAYYGVGNIKEVKQIQKPFISNLIQTETNIPYLRVPYMYIGENSLNLIYDPIATAPTKWYITYIRKPYTLVMTTPVQGVSVTTCELPVQTHTEIVKLAVLLMAENIGATERLQSLQFLNTNN